jgi:hypothetical protein
LWFNRLDLSQQPAIVGQEGGDDVEVVDVQDGQG